MLLDQLLQLAASLTHLDPNAVLARGYSLVRDSSGKLVKSGAQVRAGDPIAIGFAQGWAEAEVKRSGG